MRIKEFLNSRCSQLVNPWKMMLTTSLLVALALLMLRPWGSLHHRWLHVVVASGCGLLCALAESIHVLLLPRIFKKWYAPEEWTYGKDLLATILMLFTIAVFTYTCFIIVFHMPISWKISCLFILSFLVIVPLPTGFILMWNRNLLLARNLRMANEMNEHLLEKMNEAQPEESKDEGLMLSFAEGRNDRLEFPASDFLYAEANGNYVNIVYLKEEACEKRTIRSTMKSIEEKTADIHFIVRCHRTYLVNTQRIKMVTGNAQECQLHLEGCKTPVPVSRHYRQSFYPSSSAIGH